MNVSSETIEEMIFNEFVYQARLLGFKIMIERDKTAIINSLCGIHNTAKLKPSEFTAIKMCLIASACLEKGLY